MKILTALLFGLPLLLVTVLAISFVFSWPLMVAWNYVMPGEFGLHTLTWSQAWALAWVATTLLKSTGTSSS